MNDYSSNPKITFAEIKLQDVLEAQNIAPDSDFDFIVKHREETLAKYQPVFSPDHIPFLTKSEFYDFLLFRNNHHWDSLHRVGKYMVEDIDLLREAITILLDESMFVEDRINQLRPERYWGTNSMVSHLGMPVLSAILLIVHPEKYGVWNNTSDAGMKLVRLWDKNWETQPTGKTYVEMNQIYHEISLKLNVDLWTLDALWWVLKKQAK
jgi:hypothetical protein